MSLQSGMNETYREMILTVLSDITEVLFLTEQRPNQGASACFQKNLTNETSGVFLSQFT